MRRSVYVIFSILLFLACTIDAPEKNSFRISQFAPIDNAIPIANLKPVKNIIIMIGDGMGPVEVSAARLAAYGTGMGLAMDNMPVYGNCLTYSLSDELITDSAAGGTALATGVRTYNGRIAVDTAGNRLKSILELAREMGKSAGVVVTCEITHATPACFLTHVGKRSDDLEIARQISEHPADVMLGGGYGFFIPSADTQSYRKDNLDLLKTMQEKGYTVITKPDEFRNIQFEQHSRVAGFFARKAMETADKRTPSLADMVHAALTLLSKNPNGFFLMVEGSQIDWEGHDNDLPANIAETLDFDGAVRIVSEFTKRNGETLAIVTADHETGGLSITKADSRTRTFSAHWAISSHTANTVPVYAMGPNAESFTGTLYNFQIPQLAVQGWGVKNYARFAYEK